MLQVWCQGKNPEAIEEEADTLDALLFLNAWQRGRVTGKSVFSLQSSNAVAPNHLHTRGQLV